MDTAFYYLRETLGFVPLLCLWLCFLYLLGLFKAPEAVASLYDKKRKWLRWTTYTVLGLNFFICLFAGGGHLVYKSEVLEGWGDGLMMVLVGFPLMFGSAMGAIYLACMGDEVRERLEEQERKEERESRGYGTY